MTKINKLKPILLIIIIFFSVISINTKTYSQTINKTFNEHYNRILFVIDSSNSMNYSDPDKLINEIIKMFVDSSYSQKTEIGFITYNDQILISSPLTNLKEISVSNNIKTEVDKITRTGNTDIGMAINYGMDMFIDNPKENTKSLMVLISDGETDLKRTKTGRTLDDSLNDENSAFAKANEIGAPIYSVGLSKDGTLNTQYLQKIAEKTGGEKYEITNAKELLNIFNTLFTEITKTNVATQESLKGTGEIQSIDINIPAIYTDETNIILQSNLGLKNIQTQYETEKVNIYNSKNYVSLKINQPTSASLKVSFIANKNDEIKINIINFSDVLPVIDMPENFSSAEIPIEASLYRLKNDMFVEENILNDDNFYKDLKAELLITDIDSKEIVTIPMKNTGTSFTAIYPNKLPKTCNVSVVVTGHDYLEHSDLYQMNFTDNAPAQINNEQITLLKSNKDVSLDLSSLFSDEDNDILEYKIADNTILGSDLSLLNQKLLITPSQIAEKTVTLTVSDNRGGVITGVITLNIVPFWVYFKDAIFIISCIFLALLLGYLLFAKKTKSKQKVSENFVTNSNSRFNGARFEGYFLNTLNGEDIPVLNWNASYIENKQIISLGELFFMLDVPERLPEAYKIYFEAGNNGSVIFHHDTNCVISLGRKDIPSGKKEVLNYDDKLYIIFENHVSEIDVRYKRVRSRLYV